MNSDPCIIGFLDLYDIINYTLEYYNLEPNSNLNSEMLLEYSEFIAVTPIKTLLKNSKNNTTKVIDNKASMDYVLNQFVDSNVKRLLVVDKSNRLHSIITQSSVVVDFLWQIQRMLDCLDKKLTDFDSNIESVISITKHDQVIKAFTLMKKSNVSAICVVDDDSHLVGTISLKDFHIMTKGLSFMGTMCIPAGEFLEKCQGYRGEKSKLVTCSRDTSLREILKKFHDKKVHRIWITENDRPIDVVSFRDFLEMLCNFE